MADQKTYSIRIDGVTESIKDVGTLGDAINGLGSKANGGAAGLNELGKATQKLNSFNREYQTALQSVKAELAAKNKEVKQAVDYDSALLTIEANIRDSYRDKQNLLSALGTAIKSMNTETDGQKQRQAELIQQYNELNNELKEMDAAMGNHQRNVGNYEAATVSLKQQLADLKAQMAEMLTNGISKTDPAFVELAKKAGELKDAIGDAGEEINRFASDTKALDSVIDVAQSATAAFGLFEGAMSAFGMETENAEAAIQKLMGAMTIIQSLQQLQDALNKGGASAKLMNGAMKVLTLGIKGTTTATKALRIALASIGIGIVIALLTTLIANWEKIYGWFQKTFPVLNNLGAKFKALGKAIQTGVIDTLKTLAGGLKQLFSGDFSGAWETLKSGFSKTLGDMKQSYNKDFQESMTAKAAEESHKRTEQELAELKIQERNNKTYSKKYIDLQKKNFAERRAMARGNKEELDKIKLEEMQFFASVEDKKTAAAAAASKKRVDAAKKNAEEQKKIQEAALQYSQKVNGSFYNSLTNYLIKQKEQEIEVYKAGVKLYEAGPIEKYLEEVEKLNKAETELYNLNRQLKLQNYFDDFVSNIDSGVTSLNDFMVAINHITDRMKEFGKEVPVDMFDLFASQEKMFVNLTADQMKYLYKIVIDYMTDGLEKAKTVTAEESEVVKKQLEGERKQIELTGLKFELTEDKKSQAAIDLQQKLKKQWDDYLEHVKKIYGEDSEQYLKALKAKKDANQSIASKGNSGPFGLGWDLDKEGEKNLLGMTKTQVEKLANDVSNTMNMAFQGALNPAFDAFSMMLEFAIEEAQEALDKATEMHDKSVEKVQMSQERITELNDKLRNSSGSQLEAYKEQMADEQALLLQREAEEKRLAKEKEKREKELEKKKKQQERLNMAMNLMDAIANTAVGVTSALKWGPIIGPIFAAMIGAMGAVQIALITKQLSKMADGGLLQGPSHAQGGIPVGNTGIEVEGNEYVVNKRSTAKYLPLLQAINEEGARHKTRANQIGKFADGGTINAQRIASNFNASNDQMAIQQAIEAIDLHPVVSVVEIAKVQKNLTTVREYAGAR